MNVLRLVKSIFMTKVNVYMAIKVAFNLDFPSDRNHVPHNHTVINTLLGEIQQTNLKYSE